MPWVEIPPSSIEHLELFGYDHIHNGEGGAWYHGPKGRTWVEYDRPRVWVEDLEDAAQLGASAIFKMDTNGG